MTRKRTNLKNLYTVQNSEIKPVVYLPHVKILAWKTVHLSKDSLKSLRTDKTLRRWTQSMGVPECATTRQNVAFDIEKYLFQPSPCWYGSDGRIWIVSFYLARSFARTELNSTNFYRFNLPLWSGLNKFPTAVTINLIAALRQGLSPARSIGLTLSCTSTGVNCFVLEQSVSSSAVERLRPTQC